MTASEQALPQLAPRHLPRLYSPGIRFLGCGAFIFLLLFLKRPDALLAPQFFAEDGRIFFHDQLLFGGWDAFWMPYAGYLLAVPRSVAMLGSLFPYSAAPLVYNTAALCIAAFSCAIFFLPAFRPIVASDLLRFAVCCLAAAALDSGELSGTITQIQWYLQIAGILLLLYYGRKDFPHRPWADVLTGGILLVISLSVPLMVLVVPFAVWILLRKRGTAIIPPAALLAGVAIQLYVYANAGMGRGQSALFTSRELISSTGVYLAFRAVLSSLIGRTPAALLCARGAVKPSILIGAAALAWLGWLWWKANHRTRWNILGCLYFAGASAALSVGARNLPRVSQTITFGGERYFYLASCCLIVLAAITIERFRWNEWTKLVVLVAVFVGGLWGNFKVPPYADLHWNLYCEQIAHWAEEARSGGTVEAISAPLNPVGWTLILEGNVLTNGGFEDVYPAPWVGQGSNIGMKVTRDFHYHGNGSLVVSGTEGDVRQMVWGFEPGESLVARAAVLMPCKTNLAAALLIEDGLGHPVQGMTANTMVICGSWRTLSVKFAAPESGRVLVRLHYQGTGQSILWDDVELQPSR